MKFIIMFAGEFRRQQERFTHPVKKGEMSGQIILEV